MICNTQIKFLKLVWLKKEIVKMIMGVIFENKMYWALNGTL